MKRIISILLALSIILGLCIPASATEKEKECNGIPVIIVRGMDFAGLYHDYGTENQRGVLEVDAGEIVKTVFAALGKLVFTFNVDSAMDVVLDYAYSLLEGFSLDNLGNSVYDLGQPKYPLSADNYEELRQGTDFEFGMVRRCIEEFGEGHTYYINYDWRMNPFDVADEINAAVQTATKTTGHDKVNIVCASMGGIMTMAYLNEYGYENVNRCLFMSSTFCGAQIASDLLTGKIEITAENLFNTVINLVADNKILSFLLNEMNDFGIFHLLTKVTDYIVENYADDIYERVINPIFGHTLTLWGLCQQEDYDAAVEFMFGDKLEENTEFIKTTDKLQKMMSEKEEFLNKMVDDGVEIAITAHYNAPLVPVYKSASFNGDGILETYQMSGYATVANYGETLGDDYIAENPDYLSPDRVVDLSTALFPEYTYIIKNAPHVGCSYGTDYSDFLIWLLTYDGEFYAGASEKYPQFMVSDSSQTLKPF